MPNLASKLCQIAPKCKWDKSGTILRSVSVHFGPPSQNVLKLILKNKENVKFYLEKTKTLKFYNLAIYCQTNILSEYYASRLFLSFKIPCIVHYNYSEEQ